MVTGSGNKDATVEIVDTKAAQLAGSIRMDGGDPAGMILDRAQIGCTSAWEMSSAARA